MLTLLLIRGFSQDASIDSESADMFLVLHRVCWCGVKNQLAS